MRASRGAQTDVISANVAGFMYTVHICETHEAEYLDLVSFDIQTDIPEHIMLPLGSQVPKIVTLITTSQVCYLSKTETKREK